MIDTVILKLVEHYRQPVYQDEVEQEFEVLSFEEAALPAVVRHLLGLLIENDFNEILVPLIRSYEKYIRPEFLGVSEWGSFQIHSTGVSVLLHFEILLQSYYVNKLSQTEVPLNADLSASLELMASDVTVLTSSVFRGEEASGQHVLADKSLKVLWRLITVLLKICNQPAVLTKSSMRRLVCSLLDCTKQSIDPQDIEPLLPETLFRISEFWAYPTITERDFLEDRLAAEPMDFTVYQSSAHTWMDPHMENTIIPTIWSCLLLICAEDSVAGGQQFTGDEIQIAVMSNLGYVEMVKSFRAHFFGRDMVDPKIEETKVSTRYELNLGHFETVSKAQEQAEKEKNSMNSKPYEKIPSRFHAVLNFLSLMKNSGDAQVVQVIIAELLPVCYELLGASNDISIGKGSILLLHLLIKAETHFSNGHCPQSLLEQAENLFTALDIVVKTCRDGRTLVLVGSAQRALLRLLKNNRSDVQMRRRKATHQWFSILDAARHRTQEERLVWGILIVLIPLLYDHVLQENADALEIGRLGLSALLPIVRLTDTGDFSVHGSQVPLLAVIALSNLLVAAHPIMHKHAEKLVCELVACLGFFTSLKQLEQTSSVDRKNEDEKRAIFLHVTGLILIICGNNAYRCIEILKQENFDTSLVRCLDDAVRTAQSMLPRKMKAYTRTILPG